MKFLLHENLPLALHRALLSAGHESEHILERGLPDSSIVERLKREGIVLVTQDTDFLELREPRRSARDHGAHRRRRTDPGGMTRRMT